MGFRLSIVGPKGRADVVFFECFDELCDPLIGILAHTPPERLRIKSSRPDQPSPFTHFRVPEIKSFSFAQDFDCRLGRPQKRPPVSSGLLVRSAPLNFGFPLLFYCNSNDRRTASLSPA